MRNALSLLILAVFTMALMPGLAEAAPNSARGVVKGMAHKFGRGLSNTAFGWTSYGPEFQQKGAAGLTTGTAETVSRTSVGAVELGTFLFPNPRTNGQLSYKPLLRPVHPWQR